MIAEGHVTSLPTPERIEVIVHLNGDPYDRYGKETLILALFDEFDEDHRGLDFEDVSSGGVRKASDNLSVTVYP